MNFSHIFPLSFPAPGGRWTLLPEAGATGTALLRDLHARATAVQLRSPKPHYLLESGKLLQAFGGWDLIFYRETGLERGVAALVARKPTPQID